MSSRLSASSRTRPSSSTRNYVVKMFRQLNEGIHPEVEIGRFLTGTAALPQYAGAAGTVELVEGEKPQCAGRRASLRRKPGRRLDGHRRLSRPLHRRPACATRRTRRKTTRSSCRICSACAQIGRRTARIAQRARKPGRHPGLRAGADRARRSSRPGRSGCSGAANMFSICWRRQRSGHVGGRSGDDRADAGGARARSSSTSARLLPHEIGVVKIRHHGDFHLGQMLIVKDDVFIIDFEGEPRRALAERRRKAPAARDVAGLIRSIDYSTTAALFNAVNLTPEERTHARSRARNLARAGDRRILERLPRKFDRCRRYGRATPADGVATCSISSCWKKRSTKWNTS